MGSRIADTRQGTGNSGCLVRPSQTTKQPLPRSAQQRWRSRAPELVPVAFETAFNSTRPPSVTATKSGPTQRLPPLAGPIGNNDSENNNKKQHQQQEKTASADRSQDATTPDT